MRVNLLPFPRSLKKTVNKIGGTESPRPPLVTSLQEDHKVLTTEIQAPKSYQFYTHLVANPPKPSYPKAITKILWETT